MGSRDGSGGLRVRFGGGEGSHVCWPEGGRQPPTLLLILYLASSSDALADAESMPFFAAAAAAVCAAVAFSDSLYSWSRAVAFSDSASPAALTWGGRERTPEPRVQMLTLICVMCEAAEWPRLGRM